jgi:uncharacterized protein YqgC (DUF456 family)
MTAYSELRVRIDRGVGRGSYRVVATGPAGEALGRFKLPFSEIELENFILKIGSTRRGRRRIESPEMELAKAFGGKLFGALFGDEVRELYRSSVAESRSTGRGLRVTLSLTGAPELLQVPWEFLYDHPSFLSISTWTPIVRYLDLPKPRRPLQVDLPIRVLGLVSAPSDAEPIDAQQERTKLEGAVAPLIGMGAIAIDWLEEASLRALQRQLRKADYHVFHFIGHGGYDQDADDGILLFEDEFGRGRRVSGIQVGTILADEVSLRLAVLNSCEGGRSSLQDPFSGVATSLIEREIPAVIGMQFEITDRAAIVFAGEFYSALADGLPVDSAVAEARKAIYADQNDVEWGTPVLFMRVADGRLFDVKPHTPIRTTSVPPQVSEAPTQVGEAPGLPGAVDEEVERQGVSAEAPQAEVPIEQADAEPAHVEPRAAEQAAASELERLPREAPIQDESDREAEAWISESDVVRSPDVGPQVRADIGSSAIQRDQSSLDSGAPVATARTAFESARMVVQDLPPGSTRVAMRAGIGTAIGLVASQLFLQLTSEYGYQSLDLSVLIIAIAVAAAVTFAEARLPLLRVPGGSLYQLTSGNRPAAAAIQGALVGTIVGFFGGNLALGAIFGTIGFAITEWLIERILRRRT